MDNNKEIFKNIENHLLQDMKPSEYLNWELKNESLNEYPFTMLSDLKNIEQNKQHHPEGNVWNHTMLVIDNAAGVKDKSEDKRVFMWAALLHDIGKAKTTKFVKGK